MTVTNQHQQGNPGDEENLPQTHNGMDATVPQPSLDLPLLSRLTKCLYTLGQLRFELGSVGEQMQTDFAYQIRPSLCDDLGRIIETLDYGAQELGGLYLNVMDDLSCAQQQPELRVTRIRRTPLQTVNFMRDLVADMGSLGRNLPEELADDRDDVDQLVEKLNAALRGIESTLKGVRQEGGDE